MTEGLHEWEVKLIKFASDGVSSVCVGVAIAPFTNYNPTERSNLLLGYEKDIPGWSFGCLSGRKYHNDKGSKYAKKAKQGDVIRVRLDLDRKTIEFFVNNVNNGIAYHNVVGPVRAAVSLRGQASVLLEFPPITV